MIRTLQAGREAERDIWLYDTFEGMTEPGEPTCSAVDPPAKETWEAAQRRPASLGGVVRPGGF